MSCKAIDLYRWSKSAKEVKVEFIPCGGEIREEVKVKFIPCRGEIREEVKVKFTPMWWRDQRGGQG